VYGNSPTSRPFLTQNNSTAAPALLCAILGKKAAKRTKRQFDVFHSVLRVSALADKCCDVSNPLTEHKVQIDADYT